MKEDEILYTFVARYCASVDEDGAFEISRNFIWHLFQLGAHEIYFFMRDQTEYTEIGRCFKNLVYNVLNY